MSTKQYLQLCILGVICLCATRVSAESELSWQETTFQTNGKPQTVTIAPHTVLYQCGLKSSHRQKYAVNSDLPLYSYTVDKSDLKDVKIKGTKLSFTFERRSACANRTVCEASCAGRIVEFEKCFVLNNAMNNQQATAVLELTSKWDDKTLVIFVVLGLIAVGLGVVVCCILSRVCQCAESCDCCAGVWHYYGKAKRKGYSPYQVSAV